MNALIGNMKIRLDENDAENYVNVKKINVGDAKTEVPKRAALGDLQNRVQPRAGFGKDAVQKNIKDAKLPVKSRVDSHWKKGEFPAVTANSPTKTTATTTISTKTTRAAVLPASKVVTRSNSVRLAATKTTNSVLTVSTASNGLQRQGAVAVQSKDIKTVTTKMVENKLQQVKIINKEKTHPAETKLRREDSNISRKSLTKLKAALAREVKTDTAKTKSNALKAVAVVSKIESQTKPDESKETQSGVEKRTNIPSGQYSAALLKNVRNIDEGDEESLILVSEYVNDIYEYLFQLEIEQPIRKNHLDTQKAVTPTMREVLLDWINEVHLQFHLVAETFHITVAIIDRYLQRVNDTKRTHLQLVGVTALFLAAKYEELYPPSMADFIYMTDHSYNQKQILEMEIQMFQTLDCNLSRPVSIHFLRRFSKAADIEDFQHAMSKYFLELAAINYELASYKPSEIAAASLFLSLHMSKGDPDKASGFNDSYWNATLEYYSHYTAEHLRPITRKIASIARKAPSAKLNAVYSKYQSSKLYKASLRPVLYSELMDSIIGRDA